ncbi:(Fe-S)-binding protein [Helicobacter anatolicus]|uniref:(Fe-S)-binding protein n=1 Tax=Helicobacter anatolicus TaxID=2905874 RepID=UPI001E2D22CA|nr:(Fe-S)-binding protein [Helicobacter anatolicus]MCE3038456.1 (Fe-S)-binding protein [Helicobacter anatolicus]
MQDIASACVKCAKCIQGCATYQIHRDEVHSPRGFLELIKSVEIAQQEEFLDTCFLCTHCVSACPIGLPIDFAIMQSRRENKQGVLKRFYFFLLRHRKIMDFVFLFLSFLPPCFFKQKKVGVIFKIPFKHQAFLQKYKKYQSKKYSRKVAIFIGCLANYNYSETGDALLKILDSLEIEALIPKQECCSAPALFSGDFDTSLKLIKKNIIYFEKIIDEVEAILIPEATCASVIIKDWQRVLEYYQEEEYLQKLKLIQHKFFLTSVFFAMHTDLRKKMIQTKQKITYHDPCHACKSLKIKTPPRELLQHYDLVELEDSESCCGFGGITLQIKKNDLIKKVGEKKIDKILETNAEIVSAECSACHAQIATLLAEKKSKVVFKHPLELIAQTLKKE